MLCGYLPFDDESKSVLYDKILACQYKIPRYVSPLAADLLSKILVRKVSDRYTIEQIKAHPWFQLHQPSCFIEGLNLQGKKIPVGSLLIILDKNLAKLSAYKMEVNPEAIARMIGENEHNKYTMLYYLLKRRADRGDLDVEEACKEIDMKFNSNFQSDNEKTAEIKFRQVPPALHQRTDSLQLKTLKTVELMEGPRSDRKAEKPSDIVIEFKEKITFNSKGQPMVSDKRKELIKKRSLYEPDNPVWPPTTKASKSEGKHPAKIGVAL